MKIRSHSLLLLLPSLYGTDSKVCGLPPVTGPCRALLKRFFYNSTSKACETFVYGGCRGNANRFFSSQQCKKSCGRLAVYIQDYAYYACQAQGVQLCSLKPDSGPCEAYVPSYFYNSTSGKCESFVYGGCNGNANRFSSRDQCRKECGQLLTMHVNNRTLIALIILPRTVCSLPADAGNCRAAFPAFYYDAQVNKCKSFVYGGCGGNGNRFQSVDMCRRDCGKFGVPSLFTN